MSERGNNAMRCPKCSSTNVDQCPTCRQGLKRCRVCGFVAEERYFKGEPLPSEKEAEQRTLEDILKESGLNGP